VKRKAILKLTLVQKAQILGDPTQAPDPLTTNVALAKAERPPLRCLASVTWIYVRDELPDDELTVLVAYRGEGDAHEGYHEDGAWRYVNSGGEIKGVYAWANLPETPGAPVAGKERAS
jgi:hypothetical protein